MNKYDDIIDLPHHVSATRKPMTAEARAAQFSSFAALNGHQDAIDHSAKEHSHSEDFHDEDPTMPDIPM